MPVLKHTVTTYFQVRKKYQEHFLLRCSATTLNMESFLVVKPVLRMFQWGRTDRQNGLTVMRLYPMETVRKR